MPSPSQVTIEADDDFEPAVASTARPDGDPVVARVPASLAGTRLDLALAHLFPDLSRARLQSWIREGRVTLDARPARASARVHGGEDVEVAPDLSPTLLPARPEPIPLAIVHEDESIIVLDKPAGLIVHPGAGHAHGTLLNALLHHDPQAAALPRAGLVHRLDKDTSGLMVVARTLEAHTALVRALAARQVERIYHAVVCGRLASAETIDAPIGRHPVHRTRMAVVASGRPARTHVRPLSWLGGATRVECRLETGRTHQIRVHLARIGLPLLGDPVYGPRAGRLPPALAAVGSTLGRQALHAVALGFAHPADGRALRFASALPADIEAAVEALSVRASTPDALSAPAGR